MSLSNLFAAFVLLLTVATSVSLGIATAYCAVLAILNSFGSKPASAPPAVLVPSQSHASGD